MKIPKIPGFDQGAVEKYVKNTGWLMFGKILSMFVSFMIAKYLGPSSFGDLSFVDALTAIVAAIGTLGLDTFIIREIINEPAKRDEILGTSLWMRLGVSLIIIPASVAIYTIFRSNSETPGTSLVWLVFFLSLTSFFRSFNIIDSYFQSKVESKYVVQVQNICVILSAILKILLVWAKAPLIWFAIALAFDAFILALGLIYMYHLRGFKMSAWTFNTTRAKSLLRQSFPLIISAVMVSIYMKIDTVMLKPLAGSIEVGIYSAAARISEAWYFIPTAIVTSLFPAIINARKTDHERYHKRLVNLYDLLVGISLPVALFISFFANDIIYLIFADKYTGAGTILSIHIWSGIFVFLGIASSQYLLAEGFTTISFQRTGLGAIANVLLNLWLIPIYGGVGASIATMIACFISAFYILLIPKTRAQGILMIRSLLLVSLIQKVYSGKSIGR